MNVKAQLKYGGIWHDVYGDVSEREAEEFAKEMSKPKQKRKYIYGIDFSGVDEVNLQKVA